MSTDDDSHKAHSHATTQSDSPQSDSPQSDSAHAGHDAGATAAQREGHDQHAGHSPEMFRNPPSRSRFLSSSGRSTSKDCLRTAKDC